MSSLPMRVKLIDGGRKFQTINQEEVFGAYIPAGFICDYASVPRGLHWLIPPAGARYTKPAMLHDYAYQNHSVQRSDGSVMLANYDHATTTVYLGRRDADDIFLAAMVAARVKKWRRLAMYWAVRLFGHKSWSKKR